MGSNTEKKPWTNLQNSYNREKSNIAITILEKLSFLKGNKIISQFDEQMFQPGFWVQNHLFEFVFLCCEFTKVIL